MATRKKPVRGYVTGFTKLILPPRLPLPPALRAMAALTLTKAKNSGILRLHIQQVPCQVDAANGGEKP